MFDELLEEFTHAGDASIDNEREVAVLPVNPQGVTAFGDVIFPAKLRAAMRLLVHVPASERKRSYRVAVRQLWEHQEVGRVTWQLELSRKERQTKG